MKNIKQKTAILFSILVISIAFTSCSKSDSTPETPVFTEPTTPSGTTIIYSGGNTTAGGADGALASATYDTPYSICKDAAGNLYTGEKGSGKIRKISSTGIVSTLVNNNNLIIGNPLGLCADPQGNLYVADGNRNCIFKVTAAGVVSNYAGVNNGGGLVNGAANVAEFYNPSGICIDALGNLYVADSRNNAIRKIASNGFVTTVAGNVNSGFVNGNGATALFDFPAGICVDANNNIFVVDANNFAVRKITPTGAVSTLAGSGSYGFADGLGSNAKFDNPWGICVNASGTLFVADTGNKKIRQVSQSGAVTTVITSPSFDGITDLALIGTALYVTDPYKNKIHKVQL